MPKVEKKARDKGCAKIGGVFLAHVSDVQQSAPFTKSQAEKIAVFVKLLFYDGGVKLYTYELWLAK